MREVYRRSKAALNMFMRSCAARPSKAPRAMVRMAPGWVRTELGGPDARLSIDESVPKLVHVLLSKLGRRAWNISTISAEPFPGEFPARMSSFSTQVKLIKSADDGAEPLPGGRCHTPTSMAEGATDRSDPPVNEQPRSIAAVTRTDRKRAAQAKASRAFRYNSGTMVIVDLNLDSCALTNPVAASALEQPCSSPHTGEGEVWKSNKNRSRRNVPGP